MSGTRYVKHQKKASGILHVTRQKARNEILCGYRMLATYCLYTIPSPAAIRFARNSFTVANTTTRKNGGSW